MTNAERILQALDRRLTHTVELTLFGRAALTLGFSERSLVAERSMDVDAIIPSGQLQELEADEEFWIALEETNQELEAEGLYLTHLFQEDQIALSPGWAERRERIGTPATKHLRLWRPAVTDLILTKMMRGGDDEDMTDIRFLLRQPGWRREDLCNAMQEAVLPDVPEIRALFDQARQKVLDELK